MHLWNLGGKTKGTIHIQDGGDVINLGVCVEGKLDMSQQA